MKLKLILGVLIAAASAFAQTSFSIRIGSGYPRGYYAPAPVYRYAPQRAYGYYEGPARRGYYEPAYGGAGYWGEDPEREHRRSEWRGLHNHQEGERYMYGDSHELREHQEQERHQLRHEQWHERNGDWDATDGPAHGSARDGMYR